MLVYIQGKEGIFFKTIKNEIYDFYRKNFKAKGSSFFFFLLNRKLFLIKISKNKLAKLTVEFWGPFKQK